MPGHLRKLVWLVDTLATLKRFPESIRQRLGFAIYQAQIGQKHVSAKPLHGFPVPVWEVRAGDRSGTYRAVYTVHFADAIYVLHAFHKKAVSGTSTPERDIALLRQRLKLARCLAGLTGG